jgi:hypothetical protein
MSGSDENLAFPIYVFAKDCGDVIEFPSLLAMQRYLEPIDVMNEEYEAWDGDGYALILSVSEPKSLWLKLVRTEGRVSEKEFAALRKRAEIPKAIRS